MDEIKLRFKLDPDRITLDQLLDMQDGNLRAMRDVLAVSLIDGDNTYTEYEEAKRIIGGLKLSQVQQAAEAFAGQVKDTAVNPPSDGS